MTPEAWRQSTPRERRDFLVTWCGKRSNVWIARRIGTMPSRVYYRTNHYRVAPTRCQGTVTASQAAIVLGMTPQGAARLCRLGKLPARKNPQRRHYDYPIKRPLRAWWLIRLEDVAQYAGLPLSEAIRQLADPNRD